MIKSSDANFAVVVLGYLELVVSGSNSSKVSFFFQLLEASSDFLFIISRVVRRHSPCEDVGLGRYDFFGAESE